MFDLNEPAPEDDDGNVGIDLNEPQDDNDDGNGVDEDNGNASVFLIDLHSL